MVLLVIEPSWPHEGKYPVHGTIALPLVSYFKRTINLKVSHPEEFPALCLSNITLDTLYYYILLSPEQTFKNKTVEPDRLSGNSWSR